jgi:hypothetical protein
MAQLDGEKNYVVEFSYRLDTGQLPGRVLRRSADGSVA